jgi:DNA-binding MarR family transcriptional regulator
MARERDFVSSVIRLANLLNRRMGPLFEKAGITPQQWSVLTILDHAQTPMTLASIARELSVSKQNMTGMIDRLQQLGLVERADDPNDLRSARVQLTRRGRTLLDRMAESYEEWRKTIGGEISDRELRALARAVRLLIERLEQQT